MSRLKRLLGLAGGAILRLTREKICVPPKKWGSGHTPQLLRHTPKPTPPPKNLASKVIYLGCDFTRAKREEI
jgi:hypothetical protein